MSSARRTNTNYTYKRLTENTIKGVAEYMQSKDCRNIVVMLGAGVSTSAGIPDFRSPETGLYSTLAHLRLPYPEAVFEMTFFRKNPIPFYTLAQELYPGHFRPTITHSFLRLLFVHNLLYRCFTQNIDTLELRAGVPSYKIIHAHGSFASQKCIDCGKPYDSEKMKEHILTKKVAHCEKCKGLVKPDIVFFGENLPEEFGKAAPNVGLADLLIVIGTSLTVQPFASLASLPSTLCPRVLINLERVGDFGKRPDDVILLGKCDDVVKDLAKELGWDKELGKLWDETKMEKDDENNEEVKDVLEQLAENMAKNLSLAKEVEATSDLAPETKQVSSNIVQGEKLPKMVTKTAAEEISVDKQVAEATAEETSTSKEVTKPDKDAEKAKKTANVLDNKA